MTQRVDFQRDIVVNFGEAKESQLRRLFSQAFGELGLRCYLDQVFLRITSAPQIKRINIPTMPPRSEAKVVVGPVKVSDQNLIGIPFGII